MKSRIIGDPKVIERVENAKPGDKSMYINLDAIRELPEEYEVVLTEIKIDPAKDFQDVGSGNMMPTPQLMYRIAEAKGIHGGEKSISEPVIEDVDINPMLMKQLTDPPTIQRRTVGRKVTKYSLVTEEDGTLRRSSPCTCLYNVWERCLELWSAEEVDTAGYKNVVDGPYTFFKKPKTGPHYKKNGFDYELKYDTPLKRKLHLDKEMKFAHAKAETKAHEKTIRELAGMMTGYTADDLKDGRMVFAKVRRSALVLKLETAARVDALRRGIDAPRPVEALFGSEGEPPDDSFPDVTVTPEPEPEKTAREEMIALFTIYRKDGAIPATLRDTADRIIAWLEATEGAEADAKYWPRCVGQLSAIEAAMPETARISHRKF
jgi:hypothetical protein